MTYKLTKLAETDLASLIDHSLERFGSKAAPRFVDRLERSLDALARGDFDGPELSGDDFAALLPRLSSSFTACLGTSGRYHQSLG